MGLNLPEESCRPLRLITLQNHCLHSLRLLPCPRLWAETPALLTKMATSTRARVTNCLHHRQAPSQSSVTYLPPNQPGVTGLATQEAAQTLSGGNLFVNGHTNPWHKNLINQREEKGVLLHASWNPWLWLRVVLYQPHHLVIYFWENLDFHR